MNGVFPSLVDDNALAIPSKFKLHHFDGISLLLCKLLAVAGWYCRTAGISSQASMLSNGAPHSVYFSQ